MKIFDGQWKNENGELVGWKDKVNFVDKFNTIVGYDYKACCCEDFRWWISDSDRVDELKEEKYTPENINLDDYYFDHNFCIRCDQSVNRDASICIFMLKPIAESKNRNVYYLHLYNCHNGYYSHGFEMAKIDNKNVIQKGVI